MTVFTVWLAVVFTGFGSQPLQTPDPNRIEEVRVSGNRRIPTDTIKYNLQSKPGGQLDKDVIRRDIKALYALGHFDDIRVEEEPGTTGQIVTFVVKEKRLIRSIKYDGIKSVTGSDIAERFRETKTGVNQEAPYDPIKIKKATAVIKTMLAEKGREDATIAVMTEDIAPGAVGLTFKVDEGPKIRIQKITIQGNKALSSGQIKDAMKAVKE